MKPVRWGILGTAEIALTRVIPAMQSCEHSVVTAIASRVLEKAQEAAAQHGIAHAYGSYAALLDDPDIDVVYNPLPNHLHLEWSARALRAGKHVLCEKPIAMNQAEVHELIHVRDETGLHIEEAIMIRNHPQWSSILELIAANTIGTPQSIQLAYAYREKNRNDYRYKPEMGGGAVYDIGSYSIAIARLIFGDEPNGVLATLVRDENTGVDVLASAILDFPAGHATLTVATESTTYQHVHVLGDRGWIRVEFPFAHPQPTRCHIYIGDASSVGNFHCQEIAFDPINQYTLQADRFSLAIQDRSVATWPLENAAANMAVIDALFESARFRQWTPITKTSINA